MGDVYLAERDDGAYEEQVAIKVSRTTLGPPELKARFLSERRLMAELRHPNIARLLDAGTLDDERPYFVMELVEGLPIDEHCRQHGLSVRRRLRLMTQVAGAVAHAHRHLVVHRDLKPANIFVDSKGKPLLLDFGIAKDLSEHGKTPNTHLLMPMTPQYASPEQLTGAPVTTATDVYALGRGALRAAHGAAARLGKTTIPFPDAPTPRHRAVPSHRVEGRRSPDGRRLRSQLSGDLDALVMKALNPDPEQRYSSIEALEKDMSHYLDGRPLEARRGWTYRAQKWVHRYWGRLAVAAAVSVILADGASPPWKRGTSVTRDAY